VSVFWWECPKCGEKYSFPFGIIGIVRKLEITCKCGEKILHDDKNKPVIPDRGDLR
jgi:hypothetical protein